MHTQSKWTVNIEFNGIWVESKNRKIAKLGSLDKNKLANANRIVQMHNSFDDLLEACKIAIFELQPDGVSYPSQRKALKQIRSAIAKAEANN